MSNDAGSWRRCSSCRKDIAFSTAYWVCNVSTCNRKRTGMVFCSVSCWEVHLPMMRHRESYAVEKRSPSREKWTSEQTSGSSGKSSSGSSPGAPRKSTSAPVVRRSATAATAATAGETTESTDGDDADLPRDILVVVSKLKKYIKQRSGMSTSETALEPLSDCIRTLCNQAIRNAGKDGRKTVMGRDIPDANSLKPSKQSSSSSE